jgi:thiamine biosynthesis lipoprotein
MAALEQAKEFPVFGSRARIIVGPSEAGPVQGLEIVGTEFMIKNLHRLWTRFEPSSALSALNSCPAEEVEGVQREVGLVFAAGIWAAERTGWLADPFLLDGIEDAGYSSSLVGAQMPSLEEALERAPSRRPACPRPPGPWRQVSVDVETGLVCREPGLRFDPGGCGKGLAADLAADRLSGLLSYAVDMGGDVRMGGLGGLVRDIHVEDPFHRGSVLGSFQMTSGGVATSGLAGRLWRQGDAICHHLLDPSTGCPAWTGVVQATALGGSALEAEALAKASVLAGPEGGVEMLSEQGGVLVLDDGSLLLASPLQAPGVVATR